MQGDGLWSDLSWLKSVWIDWTVEKTEVQRWWSLDPRQGSSGSCTVKAWVFPPPDPAMVACWAELGGLCHLPSLEARQSCCLLTSAGLCPSASAFSIFIFFSLWVVVEIQISSLGPLIYIQVVGVGASQKDGAHLPPPKHTNNMKKLLLLWSVKQPCSNVLWNQVDQVLPAVNSWCLLQDTFFFNLRYLDKAICRDLVRRDAHPSAAVALRGVLLYPRESILPNV